MKANIRRSVEIERTPRVLQLEGMFDVPPAKRSEQSWSVDLPIEDRSWSIGLVVGPSGSGKTSIARELFGDCLLKDFDWDSRKSVIDAFPRSLPIKEITLLLSSVGFSSPPSWLRPFAALSNGEQFRVNLARVLAESPEIAVVDEFTSVVDRTVAQIGSAAVSKTVRRLGKKFVALSCHDDVEAWLQPDWIYQPHLGRFQWRELQRRPPVELKISRVHHSAWSLFAKHHYLSGEVSHGSMCFVAFIGDTPVAFDSYMSFFGKLPKGQHARRGHRSVCIPDYQGIGIGTAMIAHLSAMWKGLGYRVFQSSSHPALIQNKMKSPLWKMTRPPSFSRKDTAPGGRAKRLGATRSSERLVASFEYIEAPLEKSAAERQLNSWALQ